MKRLSVLLAVTVAALGVTACTSRQRQGAWCAVHAAMMAKDVAHHKPGWATLQGALAAHHCRRAVSR